MKRSMAKLSVVLAWAVTAALSAGAAKASFITWDSRPHSGDITADTPSHSHDSAGYVAAWNAIASETPGAGYGDGGFDDWTNQNNQSAIPSGSSKNYGLHASFTFYVPANDTGSWTFNIGNDADYGGTVLLDGTELGTNPGNYYPVGPSGSRTLGVGFHTVDVYSFEACCDGGATSTFQDPLHTSPLTINNTNLMTTPEPAMLGAITLSSVGLLARRRRAM